MTITRRRFLLVGAVAVGSAAALASACGIPAPAPPVPTPAPTPLGALKIGVLLPYTESSIGVDIGLNQKRAADLYLKQHGGTLGGRTVSLVYSAESIEPAINKTKIRTLLDTEHVELLMGGATSDTSQVMREAAEAAKVVYIATNATANSLTRESRYVFRTSATAWQLSEPLGEWASTSAGREFYVSGVDDTFGSESMDAFVAGLAKNGGTPVTRSVVPSGADWTKVIAAIKGQPAKNVFAALYTDDAEGFLEEWNKQGLSEAEFKLYGPGPLADEGVLAQVKSAAKSVTSSLFWSPDLDNPENKALVEAFPKEYIDDDTGQPVRLSGYAVQMWDAMTALDVALQQTGGIISNPDALASALEGVSFKSPRGTFAFDKATRTPTQDIFMRQVQASADGTPVNGVVSKVPNVAATD